MSDLTYFDGDYFEGKYFTVVKEATVGVSDYFETDYILPDYFFRPPNTTFGLSCSAFSFVSKWNDSLRPIDWDFYQHTTATGSTLSEDFTLNTSIKAEGTSSLTMPDLEGNGDGARSYYAESDVFLQTGDTTGKDWVLDFWYYMDYSDADNIAILTIDATTFSASEPPIDNTNRFLQIYKNADDLQARIYDNSGTPVTMSANSQQEPYDDFNLDAWNHISLVYDHSSSTITLRLNKDDNSTQWVRQASGSFDQTFSGNCRIRLHQPALNYNGALAQGSRSGIVGFDAVRFAVDTTNYTRTVADLENTLDTYVLARFNNSFDDDLSIAFTGAATLNSSASVTADAGQALGLLATLDSDATVTADADQTFAIDSNLSSVASMTADTDVVVNVAATLNSATSTSGAATVERSAATTVNSVATASGSSSADRGVAADLSGVFTPTITASALRQNDIDLAVVATVECSIGLNKPTSSSISSSAGLTATGLRVTPASCSISSTTTTSATVTRIFAGASTLNNTTTFSSAALKLVRVNTTVNSVFETDFSAVKSVEVFSSLNMLSEMSVNAGYLAAASSSLASVFGLTSSAFVLDLDTIIYTVPDEDRTQPIGAEDRTYSLLEETRTITVDAENRTHSIDEETRTYSIEGTD